MSPNYRDWWVGRRVRRAGSSGPFKKCVRVEFHGPPSEVYGFVTLHFEDGTSESISPLRAFKPRKKDVEVHPDDRDKTVCVHPYKSRAEYKKYAEGEPLECTLDHCLMYPFEGDYRDGQPKCNYKRREFSG